MFKKILKRSLLAILIIFLAISLFLGYLFFSADMCIPEITEEPPKHELVIEGNYRKWGENILRKSETGLWEMKVKGEAYERGIAIGKLSEDLLYFQEKVFVDQIRVIVPSDSYLRFLGAFTIIFNRNLGKNVPEEFRREIYGISQSCSDEFNFISTAYERQLNYHAAHDLGHAMQDYMLVGCSSFASWGDNSADSTLIVGRNFDFYVGDEFAVNKEILFYEPDNGYKFVSVSWPGMTGVLSGMNEAGLTVTINAAKSTMPTSASTPISILVREILQYASTIDEAYKIAQKRNTFVAESILVGSAKDKRAAIIEKSPSEIALFNGKEGEQQIICTNHFQSDLYKNDERNVENIKTTDTKYRYDRLTELLKENRPIDEKKVVAILRNRNGINNVDVGLTNEAALNQLIAHHSVIFKPEKGIMWVSTSPWQLGKYVAYDLNKIFSGEVDFRNEIYSAEYTIPADSMLYTDEFKNLMTYKSLTKEIRQSIKEKKAVAENSLSDYEASNPEYYYTYEIIGDYYNSIDNKEKATLYWQKALTKVISRLSEKERISEKLKP